MAASHLDSREFRDGLLGTGIAAIGLLLLYSLIVTTNYSQLSNSIDNLFVVQPPIRFYVNVTPINYLGLTHVALSQNFCPESNTTIKQAAANFRLNYYVNATPGQGFAYSLVYDPTQMNITRVVVLPPFKLDYYWNHKMNVSDCVGYPNALENFTMVIQAPNSTYVGSFYAVVFADKK
ncbi:MAG: hypothetical protein KGH65_01965 [Candidatus Micrarchaeota archaeon]|nr:hypothetical protein [Candidatus Micrarchaeota archaeon]